LDQIIAEETSGKISYKIGRKTSGDAYTDYVIFKTSSNHFLSPIFSELTDQTFDDIFELGKYYFLRSEKFYSGFAFMDTRKLNHIPVDYEFEKRGRFLSSTAAMTYYLNNLSADGRISLDEHGFHCATKDTDIQEFLNSWLKKGYINADPRKNERVIFKFINPYLGYLSNFSNKEGLIINSNFFVLETADMKTPYSMIGQPFGALIKNGKVILPPLFKRPVLLKYKDGRSEIKMLDISDVSVIIGKERYKNGENALFYRRPEFERTPTGKGIDLIVVNDRIMSFKTGGGSLIPDAGFVIQLPSEEHPPVSKVEYFLNNTIEFAIQAGPALVREGQPMTKINGQFKSCSTNGSSGNSFPPNVFETQWDASKAARIGFGFSNKEIVILWVAGCNTGEYIEGFESEGFTFKEMAETLLSEGVKNAISLDGGGSAQVLNRNARALRLADRRGLKGHEFERPTPVGIKIKL